MDKKIVKTFLPDSYTRPYSKVKTTIENQGIYIVEPIFNCENCAHFGVLTASTIKTFVFKTEKTLLFDRRRCLWDHLLNHDCMQASFSSITCSIFIGCKSNIHLGSKACLFL